jgi:putative protein-disulfide isomerase
MCSWCWGFAPVLDALHAEFDLPVDVLVGGLRPGPEAQVLDDRLAGFLRNEWARIAETTGQPFDTATLDRLAWTYDTELPAMAVVTMRALHESRTLPFFERIQRAFYAEAVDVTDPDAYPSLLDSFADVDAPAILEAMTGESARTAAWNDFATSRSIGVTGFPTLALALNGRLRLLTYGYRPVGALRPILSSALAEGRDGPDDDGTDQQVTPA